MKIGIPLSAALHGVAIAAAVVTLPDMFREDPVPQQVMVVDLVTLAEETSPAPTVERPQDSPAPQAPKIDAARAEPPPAPESHRAEPPPRPESRVASAARPLPPLRTAVRPAPAPSKPARLPEPEPTANPAPPPEQVALLNPDVSPALSVPSTAPAAPAPDQPAESDLAPPTLDPARPEESAEAPEPEPEKPAPVAATPPPREAAAPLPRSRPERPSPPKKKSRKFNMKRVAALLNKQDKPAAKPVRGKVQPTQMPKASQFAAASGASNTPLTLSEIDHIRHQIEQCWSVPAGVRDAADMRVSIHVSLRPDGSVIDSRIVSTGRMGEPNYRAAAESAQRAVRLCSPLQDLPVDKYQRWRELTLTFNPKEFLGG